jgi:O-antigen ligase
MLVTAIPISFSSWGIRELSAIAILGKHGIDAETSVAFGIIIGLAYFFTVCFWFVLVTVFPFKNEAKKSKSKQKSIDFENYKQPLLGLLVCLLGVVFPVQIRVPVDGGLLTLNLADPVAFLAGLSFLISWIIHYRHLPLWMVSSFKYGLILLPIIFVVSYVIGFFSFGSNSWALVNRLVGLFVPFSFLFTGAILGMFLERTQVRQLFFSLSISLLGYAVFQICFQFYVDENIKELFGWSNLSGFYQDRNAYSLFLLLALAGLLPLINDTKNVFSAEKLLIALIVLALFVAGSRTAFVALLIVFARLIHTNHRLVFRLVPALLFLFGSYGALIYVVDFFSGINSANEVIFSSFIKSDITSISDIRLLSWSPAWNIWLENPLFGSGLGYYYEHYRVVVHNLPLWLLSETGLFGFLLFSIIPISIFQACFPLGQKDLSARRTSLLYGTIIIVFFSLSQDIIFQRSIWFFIGFFMVCRPIIIKKT